MSDKFFALTAAFVLCASTAVFAQSRSVDQKTNGNPGESVMQPQGKTGPIVTKRGGAPRLPALKVRRRRVCRRLQKGLARR
jgi:hypothetical protein